MPDDTTPTPPEPAAVWGEVHLMGHTCYPGRITEETRFGGTMGRVDVPVENPNAPETWETRYFTAGSVHHIEITTEEEARRTARRMRPRPVMASLPPAVDPDDDDDSELDGPIDHYGPGYD